MTHLSQWSKSRTPKTPSANKDVEEKELLFIVNADTKRDSHSERQFGSFSYNHIYT
jgi:hypothetical protein